MRATIGAAFFLLTLASAAFAADPRLGPEVPVAPYELAYSPKNAPLAGSDGRDFLVVWSDGRSESTLMGSVVTASGEILNRNGRVLAQHLNPSEDATLRWTGNAYVLYPVIDYSDGAFYSVTLARDGTVIGKTPKPHISYPVNERGETLGTDHDSSYRALLVFLDASGKKEWSMVLSPYGSPQRVEPLGGDDWAFLSFNEGGHWLKVREGIGIIETHQVIPRGEGTLRWAVDADGDAVAAIWARTRYLDTVGDEHRFTQTVGWTYVDASGRLSNGTLEPQLVTRRGTGEPANPTLAALASDDMAHFSFGTEEQQTFRVIGGIAETPAAMDTGITPAFASGPSDILVWRQRCSAFNACRIAVRTFAHEGSATNAVTQTLADASIARQNDPHVVASADGLFAVWREYDPPVDSIRVRFLPKNGPAGPAETALKTDRFINWTAAAGGDAGFVVVWLEYAGEARTIKLQRFDRAGRLLDATPVNVGIDFIRSMSVAANGDGYQLSWTATNAVRTAHIRRNETAATTVTIATQPQIPTAYAAVMRSVGGRDGTTIIWSETETRMSTGPHNVQWYALRIANDGTFGNPVPLARINVDDWTFSDFEIGVREGAFLLTWTGRQQGQICIDSRPFDLDGTALSGDVLRSACGATEKGGAEAVGWDGERWWIVPRRASIYGAATVQTVDGRFVFPVARDGDAASGLGFAGPALFYARPDPNASTSQRVFLRSISSVERRRAAR
jgi:hypothetical protein